MSDLEKEKERAWRLSNLQKYFSYITYFVILGLVILNTHFIINNWGVRINILPEPIPFHLLVILGLILLFSIIILQTGLLYQLYKLKKEAAKEKQN